MFYVQDTFGNQLSRNIINIIIMVGRLGLPKTAKAAQLLIKNNIFAAKGAFLIAICNMPVMFIGSTQNSTKEASNAIHLIRSTDKREESALFR